MTTLRALAYADARTFVNQFKAIRRSPGRAVIWFFFVLLITAGIAARVHRAMLPHRHAYNMFAPRTTVDVIAAFIIIGFGITLTYGSRLAGLFAHPAEARFIIGSPATPFIATLYVQLRDIVLSGTRRGLALIYAALIYLPDGLGPGSFVRDLVLILIAFSAIAAVPLARQLLAKRYVPLAVTAGWLVTAFGALALLDEIARAFALPPAVALAVRALPAVAPGRLLLAGPAAQFTAIAIMLAGVAALFAFVARRARDAYPELYELSMNRMQRTERLRGRMFGGLAAGAPAGRAAPVSAPAEASAASAPGGVLIFVWRAWTEYRRTSSARSSAVETALLLGGGYALARFGAANETERILPIATSLSTILFLYALSRAAALAVELRRPIFWLSDATLFERLCALALAHSWRMIAWFALAAIGLAAGHASPAAVAASALGGSSAVLLAIAVGYASYAAFPYEIDQRGPLTFARWLAGYVLAIPPVGLGITIGAFGGGALTAIVAGSALGLLEAAVLVAFAAWRLDRMSILLR